MEFFDTVIVPQLGHVQTAGGDGGAGGGAIAAFENTADLIGRDLSLCAIDNGACHGSCHVVEDAVGTDFTQDQLIWALYLEMVNGADGGFDIGTHRAYSGKIMCAYKGRGRLGHDSLV